MKPRAFAAKAQAADLAKMKTSTDVLLFKDRAGNLWFCGWEDGLVIYRYDGEAAVAFRFGAGLHLAVEQTPGCAGDGVFYLGGYEVSLLRFQGAAADAVSSDGLGPPHALAVLGDALY